uniref:Nitrate reductase 1, delta subunit n=2 Tax=Candidatus Bipolaricaulota TaxID=67810 RepID=H5SMI8_9BACT|nr:nitrate reductase 1, delta subunit [uncultured Acetothermia bacterium]BAL58890.1 nitrate reductase 1, delta subunit [Candidatus Acetothermum autotrophicum]
MNEGHSAQQVLREVYAALAELWCSPADIDMGEAKKGAQEAVAKLGDPVVTTLLARFFETPISEEEYIELFELAPRCPLYLGSHVFDEPKTCAQAAVSERNAYMSELLALYKHFGMTPKGKELPDYLPLMVEFLSLTAGSSDPLREKFLKDYLLPFLAPVRARLEHLKSPYLYLLEALERVMQREGGSHA